MTYMIRTLVENSSIVSPKRDVQKPRVIMQEDMRILPRSKRLGFPPF